MRGGKRTCLHARSCRSGADGAPTPSGRAAWWSRRSAAPSVAGGFRSPSAAASRRRLPLPPLPAGPICAARFVALVVGSVAATCPPPRSRAVRPASPQAPWGLREKNSATAGASLRCRRAERSGRWVPHAWITCARYASDAGARAARRRRLGSSQLELTRRPRPQAGHNAGRSGAPTAPRKKKSLR